MCEEYVEILQRNADPSYQRYCAADWRVAKWDDTLHYDVCCCSSLAISASYSFLARLGCSQTVRHHSGKGERCSLFMLAHLERARAVGCCYAPFSSFLIHPLSLKAPRVKWNKWWKSWTILDRICEAGLISLNALTLQGLKIQYVADQRHNVRRQHGEYFLLIWLNIL